MKLFKINYHSVQAKLNLVLIALIIIVLTGFGVYDFLTMKKKMMLELNEIADTVSERLSGSMAVAIWEMHRESGIASVLSEMIEKRIYAIVIRENNTSEAFVEMKRNEDTWEPMEFDGAIEGNFIKRSGDVIKGKEKLGSVEIFLTREFMDEDLRLSLYSLVIKIFILDLILVAGMSLII
ncbi:MAG: hypothetical protein JW882_20995, partial [Deltaproteobacteria bacterium]|nr:hypothetical protein [Deltaproteobacteria bacterium]